MAPYSSWTIDDLVNEGPIQLGLHGFCFLVSEILVAIYPAAKLYRLSGQGKNPFAHVFLEVKNHPLDIKGFRTIPEMRRDIDLDLGELTRQSADEKQVRVRFYPEYSKEQLCAVRKVLEDYIETNPKIFRPEEAS